MQNVLGQLLEGLDEEFYVGARRKSSLPNFLYKYNAEDPADRILHLTATRDGDCLTFREGFLLNRLVEFSIKWVGGVPLVH